MQNDKVLNAALAMIRVGVSVIPIRPIPPRPTEAEALKKWIDEESKGKRPAIKWDKYKSEIASEDDVRGWFNGPQERGFAAIGGKVSGNFEILDFDEVGLFDQFKQSWADNDLDPAILKELPVAITPRGSHHIYYRSEGEIGKRLILAAKMERIEGSTKIVPIPRIETRSEGEYAVIPPSPGAVHPSGNPYTMLHGRPDHMPTLPVEQIEQMYAIARLFDLRPKQVVKPATPNNHFVGANEMVTTSAISSSLKPGDDFNQHGETEPALLEPYLERAGWRCVRRYGQGASEWARPGKSGGQSATLNHDGRMGVFHNFTSSTGDFKPETSYGPFQVYTILEHGGDFRQAAKALAALGYGTPAADRSARVGTRESAGERAAVQTPPSATPRVEAKPASLEGWDDPIPIGVAQMPVFPDHALPEVLALMSHEIARVGKLPYDMAAGSVLLSCMAATRGRVKIHIGNVYEVHSNGFGTIIADPSEKKSFALSRAIEPIRVFAEQERRVLDVQIAISKAHRSNLENRIIGLQNQARASKTTGAKRADLEREIEDIQKELVACSYYDNPQVIATDCNPASLKTAMASQQDCSMFLANDEGSVFFNSLVGEGGKSDLAFVLQCFNQEEYVNNRISTGVAHLAKPALTLLLMIQQDVVESLREVKGFRGQGLLSRLMCFYPTPSPFIAFDPNDKINTQVHQAYTEAVCRLFHIVCPCDREHTKKTHEVWIKPNTPAMANHTEFEDEIAWRSKSLDGDLRSISDWAGKLPGQAVRLAGLFHMMRHSDSLQMAISTPIDAEDMIRGIAICRYLIPNFQKVIGVMSASPEARMADKVMTTIARKKYARISFRDMVRLAACSPDDGEVMVNFLMQTGHLRMSKEKSPGPQGRPDYEVNPKVLG